MAVSADLLRLAIVREATPGVTPATPAFQLLRVTSESISYSPETQLSNELSPHRQVTDVIVTGGQSGGDISYELSSNPGFEMLLEGTLGNLWGGTGTGDELWVGDILLTHTIEKRFTLDELNADPLLRYEYNRVVRSLFDQMVLTFTPGGPATGSSTILAGKMSRDAVDIAGATYTDPGKLPVVVGANVIPISFVIAGNTYSAWCVSNLVVTMRNNGRAIACLGQDAANEVVLGRFECELTADIYINADTEALMDAFLNRTEMSLSFTASDALGNSYKFDFPRVRVSAATEVAAGTNQDVIMNTTMQALVDTLSMPGGGTPHDEETCVAITRTHVTTPWPEGT